MMKLKNKIFNLKLKDDKSLNPNDCKWYTFKKGMVVPENLINDAKLQGAIFEGEEKKVSVSLDLNGDGVVDKKDASIAGKVLSSTRKKRKSKKLKGDN